jgi:2-iminobutanoate/2-iminopropanoate deaminase
VDLPLSQSLRVGDLVFLSGIPPVENGNVHAPEDVAAQTQYILDRILDHLERFAMTLENLAYVQVYLRTMDDYPAMNKVYASRMVAPYPARKVILSAPPMEHVRVEISGIASVQPKQIR